MNLKDVLLVEEGYSSKPYLCSEGYPTIGYGTKVANKGVSIDSIALRVTKDSASALLEDEVLKVVFRLSTFKWYRDLDEDRRIIIKSMCYQLGVDGLLKFKRMIAALSEKDYALAAKEALDSKWYKQTPKRAIRHATVLEHGSLIEVYEGLV